MANYQDIQVEPLILTGMPVPPFFYFMNVRGKSSAVAKTSLLTSKLLPHLPSPKRLTLTIFQSRGSPTAAPSAVECHVQIFFGSCGGQPSPLHYFYYFELFSESIHYFYVYTISTPLYTISFYSFIRSVGLFTVILSY